MTFFSFPRLPILHRQSLFTFIQTTLYYFAKKYPIKMKYAQVNHRVLIASD